MSTVNFVSKTMIQLSIFLLFFSLSLGAQQVYAADSAPITSAESNSDTSISDVILESENISKELHSELLNALAPVVVQKRDLTLQSHSTYANENESQGLSLKVLDSDFEDLIN